MATMVEPLSTPLYEESAEGDDILLHGGVRRQMLERYCLLGPVEMMSGCRDR